MLATTWTYLVKITLRKISQAQIVYDFTYMEYLKRANSQRQEVNKGRGNGG